MKKRKTNDAKCIAGIVIAVIGAMLAGSENAQPYAWYIEVAYHLLGVGMFAGGIALAGGLKPINERREK